MANTDGELELAVKRQMAIEEAFSPSAPVNRRDLFSGRRHQMRTLLRVSVSRGQHAVVHGERGVGKTSLAAVTGLILNGEERSQVRINCDSQDTFESIWDKVLDEIKFYVARQRPGFAAEAEQTVASARQLMTGSASPSSVRGALGVVAQAVGDVVIFLDEFDRVQHKGVRPLLADTIKGLSDHSVGATVVIVGVGDTVGDLLAEHESIGRSVVQVEMPRMQEKELSKIVETGLEFADMSIEPRATKRITRLSQGFPHYTHAMAQEAAHAANADGEERVTVEHLRTALREVTAKSEQRLRDLYELATHSQRKDALYRQVLLACAMAPKRELGFFTATDVREPLERVTGKLYQQGTYAQHLNSFCDEDRGPVLQVRGEKYRKRYRFAEPPLQPFVILRGIQEGLIEYGAIDTPQP